MHFAGAFKKIIKFKPTMENLILLHLSVMPKSYGKTFKYYYRRGNRFFFIAVDTDKKFSMLLSTKLAKNFNLERNKNYVISKN